MGVADFESGEFNMESTSFLENFESLSSRRRDWEIEFIADHTASYRTNEPRAYADNACVRAMPPLLSDEEIFAEIANVPVRRDAEFFALPEHLRREAVSDVRELFVPTVENIQNFSMLYAALRRSYSNRHPGNRETMAFLHALASVDADNVTAANMRYLPRLSRSGGGSMGVLMAGAPGCGKTTLLDRLAAYLGNASVIFHRHINGKACLWPQVPIVRVQVPETKTVKALAGGMVGQLDAIAHTNLHATLAERRNPGYFMVRTAQILSSYMVGLIVVEDLQHLATARGDATPLLNWLGNLMELSGIPVATVATHKVHRVIRSDSGIGSKLTSGGKLEVDYLPLGPDYNRLVLAAWKLRVSHPDLKMPTVLPAICHKYTAGNRRYTSECLESLFLAMSRLKEGQPITKQFLEEHARTALRHKLDTVTAIHKWKHELPLTARETERFCEYIDVTTATRRGRGAKTE
ncbi:AAA family ATPase [Cupriavidus necator]